MNSYGRRELTSTGRCTSSTAPGSPGSVQILQRSPAPTAGVDNGVCAFGVPAQNTFGNSVNGVVRGPGFRDVDLSGFKDFRIVREQFVGFRVDAFNAFNMVSFGNPDLSMSPQFGWLAQEDAIRSVERHLQFSASYRF